MALAISGPQQLATGPQSGQQEAYIERYSAEAIEQMHRTGVPASITLAQGILESAAGTSVLATKGNNHFGIKCHSDWKGRTMSVDDDAKGECFRVYDNPEQSYADHSDFLRFNDRYKFLFDYKTTDYKAWAYGLKTAGYATSPTYATRLVDIIERYNLSRFDSSDPERIPESPRVMEEPVPVKPLQLDNAPDETFDVSLSREFKFNGVRFIYALPGETYKEIALARGYNVGQLLSYNDEAKDRELQGSEIVYLEPKKKQAPKGLDKYIVSTDGESLRDICQRFAVKMKSVCKMNSLQRDYVPREGDTIVLR